jgi:Clostripain family
MEDAVTESGSAAMSSQVARKPSDRKWTVMVFMGADRVPGNADLLSEAMNSIEAMKAVKAEFPQSNHLNIFVQLHAKNRIQRLHVGHGDLKPEDLSKEDATNGNALTSLIAWATGAIDHQRDDYSMLVMWGHSYLFGVGPQTLRNGLDALDFAELSDVLQRFQRNQKLKYAKYYPGDDQPKLDIVAFDACDLATVEMAYQLEPFSDYLLASQIGVPLPGWPYKKILTRLADPMGALMGPAELGSYIARRFCEFYAADDRPKPVTMSMLNLKRAPELFELTEALARRLAIVLAEDEDEMDLVYELFLQSRTPDGRPFIDVAALCANLIRNSGSDDVRGAAQALGNLLISPRPEAPRPEGERGSALGVKKPFIVENCRNSAVTAGMNGVSLYAPHVSDNDFERALHFYEKFLFVQKTLWSELVHGLALPA